MAVNFIYPMTIKQEGTAYNISFEHFPEIATWADNKDEIMEIARDALEAALAGRINRKEEIPLPNYARENTTLIPVPILIATKAWLYYLMKSKNISNSDLARQLNLKSEKTIRRLLDPKENSKISSIEEAILRLEGFPSVSFDTLPIKAPKQLLTQTRTTAVTQKECELSNSLESRIPKLRK